jgi:hypothetical protein
MYLVALLILIFRAFQRNEKAHGGAHGGADNRRYLVEAGAVGSQ